MMTGPSGKVMLMPEEDPKTDLIMVATGTGIAPYRGFIRRLFNEDTPAARADKGEEYADEVFTKLENGAHIYFCGLKGMMPGIEDMLKGVAEKKGLNYDEWIKELKKKKQWHVEVY